MIILISGSTHTGKTLLAQRLLEKLHYSYLSIDHLKMGLIRSGNTELTATSSSDKLTDYLWSIVKEMIKTAIENNQNLIVEGCYIPFNYRDDFDDEYLSNIKEIWLVFSENYLDKYFDDIVKYESVIENRIVSDESLKEELYIENSINLEACIKYNLNYLLIDNDYNIDTDNIINKYLI